MGRSTLIGMSRRGGRGLLLSAVVLVTFACSFRPDEFDCENAAAHLYQCCPGFDPNTIYCDYSDFCGPVYPDIGVDESSCIRSKSCDTLRSTGICDRALQVNQSTGRPLSQTAICPGTGPLTAPNTNCGTAADCTDGYVCCQSSSWFQPNQCSLPPCPYDTTQLCAHDEDCPPLQTCTGGSYCAPGIDAAVDAPPADDAAEATEN
jgi:hypothetical protein